MSDIEHGDKLYVVTRADLPGSFGFKAAQLCHAAREFVKEHSGIEQNWFEISNHIGILEVENTWELISLVDLAIERNIKFSMFNEPDLDGSLTAVTFEPLAKRMLKDVRSL